jgi:hypothetical protein
MSRDFSVFGPLARREAKGSSQTNNMIGQSCDTGNTVQEETEIVAGAQGRAVSCRREHALNVLAQPEMEKRRSPLV